MPLTHRACNIRAGNTRWHSGRCHPAVNEFQRLYQRLSKTGRLILMAYVNGDRPRNAITPAYEDAIIAAVCIKQRRSSSSLAQRLGLPKLSALAVRINHQQHPNHVRVVHSFARRSSSTDTIFRLATKSAR